MIGPPCVHILHKVKLHSDDWQAINNFIKHRKKHLSSSEHLGEGNMGINMVNMVFTIKSNNINMRKKEL